MKLVKWLAIASFVAAGVMALAAFQEGIIELLIPAVTGVVTGILMLALNRIIELLAQISSAVSLEPAAGQQAEENATVAKPTRNLGDLEAEIARLRANHTATN